MPRALFRNRLDPDLPMVFDPLQVSSVNPLYFTHSNGQPVFLTGSHTWDNHLAFSDHAFDYQIDWLDRLAALNHNFFRLWTWDQAKWFTMAGNGSTIVVETDVVITPNPYVRTGPGNANDGGLKFDLTQFNQTYFDLIRSHCEAAWAMSPRMYIMLMLWNGWSLYLKGGGENPWQGHPFNGDNNINGIDADTNANNEGAEFAEVQAAIEPYQQAYIRKVYDTVRDLPNVLFEISNEPDGGVDGMAWINAMIDYVIAYGESVGAPRLLVGQGALYPNGDNDELLATNGDWFSPNPGDALEYQDVTATADGAKVLIQDNDHIQGHNGQDRVWAWKSALRGAAAVLYMETWDQEMNNDAPNLTFRANLGYLRSYMERLNLRLCTPHNALASTGYCLANPAASGAQYLALQPGSGSFTLDVSAFSGTLTLELLKLSNGNVTTGGTLAGGGVRTVNPPVGGEDFAAYVYDPALEP